MNDTELKNKAINWIEQKSKVCRTRPYAFTPKEVADAILGTYTAVGRVATEIIAELNARGVAVRYLKQGNKRLFKLLRQPSILISACLLGQPVRYDGTDKKCSHPLMQRWFEEGRVVPVCPEMSGGLPVPRLPAEITFGAGGTQVLAGVAKVVGAQAQDFSVEFVAGARHTLALAQAHNIRVAVLKEGSPSCGSGYIYDGSFSAARVPHAGVTTALLRQSGIQVFNEHQLEQADNMLKLLEAEAAVSRVL